MCNLQSLVQWKVWCVSYATTDKSDAHDDSSWRNSLCAARFHCFSGLASTLGRGGCEVRYGQRESNCIWKDADDLSARSDCWSSQAHFTIGASAYLLPCSRDKPTMARLRSWEGQCSQGFRHRTPESGSSKFEGTLWLRCVPRFLTSHADWLAFCLSLCSLVSSSIASSHDIRCTDIWQWCWTHNGYFCLLQIVFSFLDLFV